MTDSISKKDKKDWETFLSSNEKLPNKDLKSKKSSGKKIYANFDEIQNEIRDLTDEEMDDFLENKYGAVEEDSQVPDSSDGKIIKFKPRDTFH